MRRIAFVVRGRVQGVGFRASAAAEATRLRLTGFVLNRRDGGVGGEAQGDTAAVAAFLGWLRRGPSFARVTGVEVQDLAAGAAEVDFEVRR